MLHHPDNDHWQEWREAVTRTGYNDTLKIAAQRLLLLDRLTPRQVMFFLCAVNNQNDAIAATTGPWRGEIATVSLVRISRMKSTMGPETLTLTDSGNSLVLIGNTLKRINRRRTKCWSKLDRVTLNFLPSMRRRPASILPLLSAQRHSLQASTEPSQTGCTGNCHESLYSTRVESSFPWRQPQYEATAQPDFL